MSKIPRWSQNDPRWSRIKLGDSGLTIGGHGCLLVCLAMAVSITPDKLVKMLEFTKDGLILWNDKNKKVLSKLGIDYIGRYRSFDLDDMMKVNEALKKEQVPILEVRTRRQGNHWVLPIGRALTWRGLGWASNDPWNGRREWKTVGIGAPYINELGWLLFERNNI